MGLFDGRGSSEQGSTAHVARLLGAPVVLVVDASSQSRSVAALVHGFCSYEEDLDLAGVVLNRVGSDRHEQLLREALHGLLPVVGVLRRDVDVAVPSRHLGLVPAVERTPEAVATVERLGRVVAAACDLVALLEIARGAADLTCRPWEPPVAEPVRERPVVALAGGPAFSFAYAETAETLTAAGADVVVVDPLRDQALPDRCRAVLLPRRLPGGLRRAAGGQRGAAARLRGGTSPRTAAVYAECAGLLLLCAALDGVAMVGQLSAAR